MSEIKVNKGVGGVSLLSNYIVPSDSKWLEFDEKWSAHSRM